MNWVFIILGFFQPLLPSVFSEEDCHLLLQECIKKQTDAIICCDTIVTSQKYISKWKQPFVSLVQKKAEKVQLYMSVIHGSYKADIYGLVINFNYDFLNDFALLMRYVNLANLLLLRQSNVNMFATSIVCINVLSIQVYTIHFFASKHDSKLSANLCATFMINTCSSIYYS